MWNSPCVIDFVVKIANRAGRKTGKTPVLSRFCGPFVPGKSTKRENICAICRNDWESLWESLENPPLAGNVNG